MIELYILFALMILGAIIAIETKNLLSSIISVGGVGFFLCVAFLYLQAPDIAITQLVVEITILVILIRATINRDTTIISGRGEFASIALLTCFVGIILFFVCKGLQYMPSFGEPLLTVSDTYIKTGLEKTGAANIVTSVLLDFRAYDTLGEATVLFVSIAGAILLLRKEGRKEKNARDD